VRAAGLIRLSVNGEEHALAVPGQRTLLEALRYAMSLPVATTICGIDSLDVLHQNIGIARGFKPMLPEDMQALRERCRPSSGDGHLELFKTTKKYDGKVGREQHGYPPPEQLPL